MPYRNPPAHQQHMEGEHIFFFFSKEMGRGSEAGLKIVQTLGYTQNSFIYKSPEDCL